MTMLNESNTWKIFVCFSYLFYVSESNIKSVHIHVVPDDTNVAGWCIHVSHLPL